MEKSILCTVSVIVVLFIAMIECAAAIYNFFISGDNRKSLCNAIIAFGFSTCVWIIVESGLTYFY